MVSMDPHTTFRLNLLNGKVTLCERQKSWICFILWAADCHDKKE